MNPVNYARGYLSTLKIDTPQNMLNKVTTIAIPLITLVGVSMIQGAKADDYTDCIDACNRNGRDAHPLAKLACYAMCLIIT